VAALLDEPMAVQLALVQAPEYPAQKKYATDFTPEPESSDVVSVSVAPLLTATVTLNAADGPVEVRPEADAVRVRPSAAVLIVTPLNVARPLLSVLAEAPALITPAEGVNVTVVPDPLTGLPDWSWTWTVIAGDSGVPANPLAGPWTKASLLAAPAVRVIAAPDDTTLVSLDVDTVKVLAG
jgi:hypothetical protein